MDAIDTDEHHPNEGYLMPNDVVFENPYILPEDGLSFLVTRVDEFVNGKWTNIIWEPEYEPFLFQIRSNVQFLVPHPVMIARTWHLDHSDEIACVSRAMWGDIRRSLVRVQRGRY